MFNPLKVINTVMHGAEHTVVSAVKQNPLAMSPIGFVQSKLTGLATNAGIGAAGKILDAGGHVIRPVYEKVSPVQKAVDHIKHGPETSVSVTSDQISTLKVGAKIAANVAPGPVTAGLDAAAKALGLVDLAGNANGVVITHHVDGYGTTMPRDMDQVWGNWAEKIRQAQSQGAGKDVSSIQNVSTNS